MDAKGLCKRHYQRQQKHGDPNTVTLTPSGEALAWLEQAITQDTNDCIRYPYALSTKGYGKIRFRGKFTNAHIAALTLAKGDSPPDKPQALHCPVHCAHRDCVNPKHLRWGTHQENMDDKKRVAPP